jgi:hypothetical protein
MLWLEHLRDVARARADDGSADVPWLDTRQLSSPPRPWSEEDWDRDTRRADAAGLDVSREAWQAAAELGQDIVGQLADQHRADTLAAAQASGDGFLNQARSREDQKRTAAINDELLRRARQRAAPQASQQRNRNSLDFPSVGGNDPDFRADLQQLADWQAGYQTFDP